jgi:predicted alpha/beta hydrolase
VLDSARYGSLGHFGYFRERLRERLWQEAANFLAGC